MPFPQVFSIFVQKVLLFFFAGIVFFLSIGAPLTFAADISDSASAGSTGSSVPVPQGYGVLPGGEGFRSNDLTEGQCFALVEEWSDGYYSMGNGLPSDVSTSSYGQVHARDMMACAIKSGNTHVWMLPYFLNYALDFLIRLAGIVTVFLVVLGGYYYTVSSVTEDSDTGKTLIKNALTGYGVILVSWFVVNALLIAVTQ